MSTAEDDLIAITVSDFTGADKIRVLDGGASRLITLTNFIAASESLLQDLGFGSNASGQSREIVAKTSSYTITSSDNVILCDPTASAMTINLPTASSSFNASTLLGETYTVKRIVTHANTVTLSPPGADLVEGAATLVLAASTLDYATVISDGTNWHKI